MFCELVGDGSDLSFGQIVFYMVVVLFIIILFITCDPKD